MSCKRRAFILAASVTIMTLAAVALYQRAFRWRFSIVETSTLAPGVEYRHVRFANRRDSFEAFHVVFDSSAVRASVVDLGAENPKSLSEVADDQHAISVINGGYVDPDREPVGLLRIDGVTISSLTERPPLSGCLTIDASGRLALVKSTDASVSQASSAIQAGPFLIDPNGEIGIHSDSSSPSERTLCAAVDQRICLICTTPVSLMELSRCLKDFPEAFSMPRIDRALNLDGGPSSAFAIGTSDKRIIRPPRSRIRNALVICEK